MLRARTKPVGKPRRTKLRRVRPLDDDEQDYYEGIMLGSIDSDRPDSSAQ